MQIRPPRWVQAVLWHLAKQCISCSRCYRPYSESHETIGLSESHVPAPPSALQQRSQVKEGSNLSLTATPVCSVHRTSTSQDSTQNDARIKVATHTKHSLTYRHSTHSYTETEHMNNRQGSACTVVCAPSGATPPLHKKYI